MGPRRFLLRASPKRSDQTLITSSTCNCETRRAVIPRPRPEFWYDASLAVTLCRVLDMASTTKLKSHRPGDLHCTHHCTHTRQYQPGTFTYATARGGLLSALHKERSLLENVHRLSNSARLARTVGNDYRSGGQNTHSQTRHDANRFLQGCSARQLCAVR
jgi:hypothetical protein